MAVSKRYNMLMSNEAYEAFSEIAAQENRLLADVIRQALDDYLKLKGKDVSAAVDRGGDRRSKGTSKEAKES